MGSKITLAEICTDISYGYTASATAKPVGPKFLRITDIQGGKVNWENVPYCEIDEKDSLKYLLQDGDIVIARTGNSTGENFIFSSNTKVVFASYLIRFRIDPKKANPKFIWLQMRTPQWWSFIDSVKTGSAQAGANAKVLGLYEVELPERKIQDHIADIGFNLLKKQDINSKINQTLEQMSQTLFKSWFVDFDPVIDNALDAGNPIPEALQTRTKLRQKVRNSVDFKPLSAEIRSLFPSEFEETELGWVPKGWSFTALKNFGKIICGKTPTKSNKNYYGEDFLFIKIPDMHGKVFVTNSHDKLSKLGSESQSNKIIPHGSICVSCIATVGLVSINAQDCHTNQQINSIVPNSPHYRNYLYFSMLEKYKIFHDLASGGSATLNMNTSVFSNIATLMPNNLVLKQFHKITEPWFEAILLNEYKLTSLASLRDTLLPKLISGELSLEDLPDLTTNTEAA